MLTLVSSISLALIEPILLRHFRGTLRTVLVVLYTGKILRFVLTLTCFGLLCLVGLVS